MANVYDVHCVALARLLRCRLVTIDERLLRGIALGAAVSKAMSPAASLQ